MLIHTIFDVAASLSSMVLTFLCYRWRLRDAALRIDRAGPTYALALIGGAVLGGYGLGTLNLWLGGVHEVARSIVGALAGASLAIEMCKRWRGIRGSTGFIVVPAFGPILIKGKWGCL